MVEVQGPQGQQGGGVFDVEDSVSGEIQADKARVSRDVLEVGDVDAGKAQAAEVAVGLAVQDGEERVV